MTSKKKIELSNLIPVEAVQERDTDLLILEEINCNRNFTDWLLEKTIGHKIKYDLIGAWHSLTQVSLGESDLAFIVRKERKMILFLIENKVGADFRPDQATRYKERGKQKKDNGECDEFYTILFAPKQYIKINSDFDFYLEYEEVKNWFLQQTNLGNRAIYKATILEIAIEKLRRGYTPIINKAATDFRWAYYNYAEKHFPHLKMKKPKIELPQKTGFIRFKPTDVALQNGDFIIHKVRGDVDLRLARHAENFGDLINKYQTTLTEEMEIVQTGKSVSLRIKVPNLVMQRNFNEQLEYIDIALKKVETLYEWGKKNLKKASRQHGVLRHRGATNISSS
jgi:hypothetical protein